MTDTLRIYIFQSGLMPLALMLLMLVMVDVGWRIGRSVLARRRAEAPGLEHGIGDTALIGAVFGLLALLIAFTFSGAAGRFDRHREMIKDEASRIDAAYRSVDLLPATEQPKIREIFRRYVDFRIALYEGRLDEESLEKKRLAQMEIGDELWQASLKAVRQAPPPERGLAERILPGLSEMFDAVNAENLATKSHPPRIIWMSLLLLALIGSFMSGYRMGFETDRDWLITLIFAVLMSGAVHLILNLEYPRIGTVSLSDWDQELVNLRKAM